MQFSLQSNHVHLLVEASDTRALGRGMQGLLVRLARALNRRLRRRGRVFEDHYHSRVLRTPREVRHALAYVLNNVRRHGPRASGVDGLSSGRWFDGWRHGAAPQVQPAVPDTECPVVAPRTWLLRTGWRRHGRIGVDEVPGPDAPGSSAARVARAASAARPRRALRP